MNKKILIVALALLCSSAYAAGGEGDNTGCGGQGNPNSPCTGGGNETGNPVSYSGGSGGAGGAGGVGGAGGSGGTGGSASNVNASSNAQGQRQGQTQTAQGGVGNGGNASATGGNSSAAGGSATSSSGVTRSGNSKVENAGNNTGTANVVVQGDAAQARDPVSTAFAPTIVTGSDQCLVPVSGGGQAIGFGFSFGSAVSDPVCEVLKLARELRSMGFPEQALKLLKSADPRVAAAFN